MYRAPFARILTLVGVLAATGERLSAQTPTDAPSAPTTLGLSYNESLLRDLPLSDTLYSVLETMQPPLITDRFTGGGLFGAQPARVGGFLTSWSQTTFRVGEVDITDPTGGGVPLLVPELGPWQRVDVATGFLPTDVGAPGLAITLSPRQAADRWQHRFEGFTSHGGLSAKTPVGVPSIVRLTGRDRLTFSSTGALQPDRLHAFLWASWTKSAQAVRTETNGVDAQLFSAFGSLVHGTPQGPALTTHVWVQRAEVPFEYRLMWQAPAATAAETAVHVQSTWKSRADRRAPWQLFGGYTERRRTPSIGSSVAFVERLMDGPVSAVADPSRGTVRVGTVGARVSTRRTTGRRTHQVHGGVDLMASQHQAPPVGIGLVGELVDGAAARVWQFRRNDLTSSRHAVTVAVHGGDEISLAPRLRLSLGLRYEGVTGSASGAEQGVTWHTLLPRARLWWRMRPEGSTIAFLGYTRAAYRLTLDTLAVGDPAAPAADVYRWAGGAAIPGGPIVARVGPGTSGRPEFASIDEDLARPVSDELTVGFEFGNQQTRRFQIALVGRRETGLFRLLNTGVPPQSYTTFTVSDPGSDTGKTDDDKVLTVFGRQPAAFGADRYLLTTPDQDPALGGGLELSGEWRAGPLIVLGGATASIAVGTAASRGYGPLENDQAILGESWVTPNGDSLARGRLFNDRAFTVKLAGVYRFPADVTLGVIARYQDGQNFSRVRVFPNLPQGTEAVRAFAAGDSRFKFTGTLDTRLQKGFGSGRQRFALVLDAYNLLGLTYDVEERAAAAPNDRRGIAIQPPRTIHLGVAAGF